MDASAKCRAVCAAVGKAPAFVQLLNGSETSELVKLYDDAVGPQEQLADRFAQLEERVRTRLDKSKAADERVDPEPATKA